MTDTYCAVIPLDHKPFIECPIFIDFSPDKLTGERTYVRIGSKPSTTKHDFDRIAVLPIPHPAGIVIDENNWAGFLYMDLYNRPKMRRDFSLGLDRSGCSAVYTKPSFGPYCFIIEGRDHLFGIVVQRPPATRLPERLINTATVIKSPNVKISDAGVYYTSNYIAFKQDRNKIYNTTLADKYLACFREPITPSRVLSIYVDGVNGIVTGDDIFAEVASDQDLYFLSFEGFEYFKSGDGKVMFTLQDNPVSKALLALKKTIEKSSYASFKNSGYYKIAEHHSLEGFVAGEVSFILAWIVREIENLNT